MRDEIVLNKLKKAGSKGLNCYDFPKGLHYKDAIMNLRNRGYDILMIMEEDVSINRKIGRYVYKGYTKKAQIPKAKKETKREKVLKLCLDNAKTENKELRLFAHRVYNLLTK